MGVPELKRALDQKGVPYDDCVEKNDLHARLIRGVSAASSPAPVVAEEARARQALVPVGPAAAAAAAAEARQQQSDRSTPRSERSDASDLEEFLTPGATALEGEQKIVDDLISMGFPRDECEQVAAQANGDLRLAIELLTQYMY